MTLTTDGGSVKGLDQVVCLVNAFKATPSFQSVDPIAPITINGHTYQSMKQERQTVATLLRSLNNSEQAAAKLSTTFRDVLFGTY
ncbi:DUF3500 domain-containing protein [Spirosoma validum]|uniref:DUF3500 domain-containing protein n=1 Tax=Spirosoma validum TaxID=2771355 RepID=A0A927B014_9BACT|nr:DUF3500 domain-containing protein [Spirosoma validum]MBD2752910.1 DUF3500 domain-containing protein [Spirosoma validum]